MTRDNGGPAFPSLHEVSDIAYTQGGMTLRDYIATAALQGLLTAYEGYPDEELTAFKAYAYADAMIKARGE